MLGFIEVIFSLFLFMSQQNSVSVNITGFDSDKGKAMVLLLDENEKEVEKQILAITNKKSTITFGKLKPGKYAIKAYHDANSNQKLDTNILGIPKEKWGVSNNVSATLGPPNFQKMLFEVKGAISIQIKLH
jgi:uncharacterized protein (DUF2141 family)